MEAKRRILRRVRKEVQGCWIWQGAISPSGYGRIKIGGKVRQAHRVAYEAWVGLIPEGLVLMHLCDEKRCVQPEHLIPGTPRENALDAVAKGRHRPFRCCGSENANAKLTEVQVIRIRKEVASNAWGIQASLARKYGVTPATIWDVVHRRWKHVRQ